MNYDFSKLRGKIVEKYGNITSFASKLDVSVATLSLKLRGRRSFSNREIEQCIELLGIDRSQIPEYFFKLKGDD